MHTMCIPYILATRQQLKVLAGLIHVLIEVRISLDQTLWLQELQGKKKGVCVCACH